MESQCFQWWSKYWQGWFSGWKSLHSISNALKRWHSREHNSTRCWQSMKTIGQLSTEIEHSEAIFQHYAVLDCERLRCISWMMSILKSEIEPKSAPISVQSCPILFILCQHRVLLCSLDCQRLSAFKILWSDFQPENHLRQSSDHYWKHCDSILGCPILGSVRDLKKIQTRLWDKILCSSLFYHKVRA